MDVKRRLLVSVGLAAKLLFAASAQADDEIILFNGDGAAVAYFAMEGSDITVYLWDGTPVAYLDGSSIYGFNGKHLGWFAKGAIYDHEGYAACATKDRMNSTQFEPFKAFKKFTPFKAFEQFAPSQPTLRDQFKIPCEMLMKFGEK